MINGVYQSTGEVVLPVRYEEATIDKVPKPIRELFDNSRDTRRGLYLHGGVGTGKTFIAYALYRDWQERRLKEEQARRDAANKSIQEKAVALDPSSVTLRAPAVFWNLTALLYKLRLEYRSATTDTSDELLWQKNFLFIDDIGAEKVTEWVEEIIYLTINNRYERNYPIVFTSNYSLGELSERMGDRIASRISEMCDVVTLKGNDRRIEKKNKLEVLV